MGFEDNHGLKPVVVNGLSLHSIEANLEFKSLVKGLPSVAILGFDGSVLNAARVVRELNELNHVEVACLYENKNVEATLEQCLLAKQMGAAAGKKMVGNDQVGQVIKTVLGGELVGCTDPAACNYDPNATGGMLLGVQRMDDGLCDFESCIGCTDPDACNYDATATQEDGSCLSNDDCGVCGGDNSTCGGCTDSAACNYNPEAIFEDGSCLTSDDCGVCGGDNSTCTGCTDPDACNFDETALFDDGSCVFGGAAFTLTMYDTYGDGWNGNSLTIAGEQYCFPDSLGDCTSTDVYIVYADSVTYELCIDTSDCLEIVFNADGAWVGETSWDIADASGAVLASGGAG